MRLVTVLLVSMFLATLHCYGASFVAFPIRVPGTTNVLVSDVNDAGTCVGTAVRKGLQVGFIKSSQHTKTFAGLFPGRVTAATRINNRGEVLGYVAGETAFDGSSWFIYRGGKVQVITQLGGYRVLNVGDINDRGEFVGHCTNGRDIFTFLATQHTFAILSRLPDNSGGDVWLRLNNRGQAVGYAVDDFGSDIVSTNAAMDIGFENNTLDINDNGVVIGRAPFTNRGVTEEAGFLLVDGERSWFGGMPHAVNNRGRAVGYEGNGFGRFDAFYVEGGGWVNLNFSTLAPPGLWLAIAVEINNDGVIACICERNGKRESALLVPLQQSERGLSYPRAMRTVRWRLLFR